MSSNNTDQEKQGRRAEAFGDFLYAAMKDAANGHLTQLKFTMTDDRDMVKYGRIIVIPEKLAFESTEPLEAKKKS